MTTRRRTALLTLAAVTCVAALAAAPPRPAEAAVALPARDLPSAYDAQLRDSKSVPLGRAVNFGYCAKYSGSTCTKPVPLRVTVQSISFKSANGWPEGSAIYTITMKLENFTKESVGVLPVLRCANMVDEGHYYVGSAAVQSLPPISQLTGDVLVGFPHRDSDTPDVLPSNCTEAVIWLAPGGAIQAKRGSLRMYATAYVRLPETLLASLTTEATTAL